MRTNSEKLEALGKIIFASDEGCDFLDILKTVYLIDDPVAPYSKEPSYAYFREGENAIIRYLLRFMKDKYEHR